jgi:hypothetical protein
LKKKGNPRREKKKIIGKRITLTFPKKTENNSKNTEILIQIGMKN